MKHLRVVKVIARFFLALSALCMLSVSLLAFANPQAVMDLVEVKLSNTDAFSSIRGVYGGVGLTLFIILTYSMLYDILAGLKVTSLLWGFYAFSRVLTILLEGPLGAFGNQWLLIDTFFFVISLLLLLVIYFKNPSKTYTATNG